MRKLLFIPVLLIAGSVYCAELGSGNGSNYPTALDTDFSIETGTHTAREDVPNDSAAAIIAIQTSLGITGAMHFVDTTTAQNIGGDKTFNGNINLVFDKNFFMGTTIEIDQSYMRFNNNIELRLGNSDDFSVGHSSADDEYRVVRGDNVATDANVAFAVTKSTYVVMQYGYVTPEDTEANLKALIPAATRMMWWDTTNDQMVISTGSVNPGSFGELSDGTSLPPNW